MSRRLISSPRTQAAPCCRAALHPALIALVSASVLLMSGVSAAGTPDVIVTTIDDHVDFGGAQRITDLPGPDGKVSFREALTAVNNTPAPPEGHVIGFNIPESEWWLYNDRAILRLEDGIFAVNADNTTIDFTTQTDYTGDTNPNGWEVGIYGLQPNAWGVTAISINADNCTVLGLDRVMQRGYGVSITGNDNRVINCTISGPLYAAVKVQGNVPVPAMNNTIGGVLPEERNVLSAGNSGVRIDGPTDGTVVIGNTLVGSSFAGVEVRGAYCCPEYTPYNTRVGGPTPEEANWIADNGKFGEEGFPLGDQVRVEWAVNTIVEGNIIGTTQDGSERYPGAHGTVGIGVRESEETIVRNNLVSGIRKEGVNHYAGDIFGTGINVYGPNTGVIIEGNRVGTDATGENAVPNLNGIAFGWFQGVPDGGQVGGLEPQQANRIAFNENAGVIVSSTSGVTISGNSIFANDDVGILLNGGANANQSAPTLEGAAASGSTLSISGTQSGTAGAVYRLEFFANSACDPTGAGEGEIFLGSVELTATGSTTPFDVEIQATIGAADILTATATRLSNGNTSAFSGCVEIEQIGTSSGDLDGDGVVDGADLAILLGAWGDCPPAEPGGDGGDCDACPADLNTDCAVDGADLAVLLGNWG